MYAVMLGAGYSATAALIPAMVSDRSRGPRFGLILGVCLMSGALGGAVGSGMAGRLFDLSGSYTIPFFIVAVSGVLAGAVGWRARVLRLRATDN